MEKECLWYRVLKARYGEEGGRIKEGGTLSSVWWRTVCNVSEGVGEGIGNWFEENICRIVGGGRDTLFWHDKWVGNIPLRLKFPRLFDLALEKDASVEYMSRRGWESDGEAWVWRRRLFAWEEECVRECSLLLTNIVLQDGVSDSWRWLLDPHNGYTVREAYRLLTSNDILSDGTQVDDVWHKTIPTKVSVLVWRLLRNRVPTKDNLIHRRILNSNDMACLGGCEVAETVPHLFLHCNISKDLWYKVWNWLGIFSAPAGDLRHHFIQFAKMSGSAVIKHAGEA